MIQFVSKYQSRMSLKIFFEEDLNEYRANDQRTNQLSILRPTLPTLVPKWKQKLEEKKHNQRRPAVGLMQLTKRAQQDFKERQRIQRQQQQAQRRLQQKLKAERQALIKKQKQQEEARKKREQEEKARVQAQRLKKIQEQKKKAEQQRKLKLQKQQEQRIQRQNQKKLEQQRKRQQQQLIQKQQKDKKQAELKQKQELELKDKKRNSQLSRFKQASPQIFLDQLAEFAKSIHEGKEIKCAINSVGDIKKVTKDLIIWTDSFIDKINIHDTLELNTFCVKVWNVIVNELIMKAKKDGIEIVPPTRLDAEIYKNCINTYILMINVLRVKGLEKVWMYMVGKTLHLLDFIYKRKNNLTDFKQLDLVDKKYIKKFGDNFENIYFSRLDQLTYFLFGLLLMNPYDCFIDIAQRTGNMSSQVNHLVNNLNKPWDYSIFWLLIEQVKRMPYRYFKPVIYANVLSIMNIHMIKAKQTRQNLEFLSLFEQMTEQLISFPKIQTKDPEIKLINSWVVDGYLDGEQFIDMLAPIKAFGGDKRKLLQNNNLNEARVKGTVLYYFKSEQ